MNTHSLPNDDPGEAFRKAQGKPAWLPGTQYMPLAKAALVLECTPEEILHLGVTDKLDIMAPVLRPGMYAWRPEEVFNLPVAPTLQPYVEVPFDVRDMIFLDRGTLACIERKGWAFPRVFSAPAKAREQFAKWQAAHPVDGGEICRPADLATNLSDNPRVLRQQIAQLAQFKQPSEEELRQEQERYFLAPWRSVTENGVSATELGDAWIVVDDVPEDQRTTVGNLYVSVQEVLRLQEADEEARREKVPTAREESHARKREDSWLVALICLMAWPDACAESGSAWARKIATHAGEFEGLHSELLGEGMTPTFPRRSAFRPRPCAGFGKKSKPFLLRVLALAIFATRRRKAYRTIWQRQVHDGGPRSFVLRRWRPASVRKRHPTRSN